jgi:hypothetical protein
MGAPAGRGAAPSGGFPAGRQARAPLAAVLPARPGSVPGPPRGGRLLPGVLP